MSEAVKELPTFLITLQKNNILLPNATVAEIIPYEPLQRTQNTPDWFLGMLGWRGIQVPVISFEMLTVERASFSLISVSSASLVVCRAISSMEKLSYFALVAQASPRLMKLTPEELSESAEQPDRTEILRARLNGKPVSIPDIDFIEQSILSVDYG